MDLELPHVTPELLRDGLDLVGMAKEANTLEEPEACDAMKTRILAVKMEANPDLTKLVV